MSSDDLPADPIGEGAPPGSGEKPPGRAPDGTEPPTAAEPVRQDGAGRRRRGVARRRIGNIVPEPVADAVDGVVDAAVEAAGRVPTPEPVARAASAVGAAMGAAARRWDERPGARIRRVRRMARESLPYLYDVQPAARQAIPRDLGMRTISIDEIIGTAVGPPGQRGRDFLPLRPFRSQNWQARWQRIRQATERLAVLPPIDVILFDGGYWVLDGHNRVAAALYAGQIAIDANVTELVPLGGTSHERAGSLASTVLDGRAVRTTGSGNKLARELDDDELPLRRDDIPP
jgi:hypothetical protein